MFRGIEKEKFVNHSDLSAAAHRIREPRKRIWQSSVILGKYTTNNLNLDGKIKNVEKTM